MLRKILFASVVVLVAGTGAAAYAQGALPFQTKNGGEANEPGAPPTVTEDWCGFMALAFGPGMAAPDVATALDGAIGADEISPEVAYVALLEGIPAELESVWTSLRVAGQQLTDGQAVSDPGSARAAAAVVDDFMDTTCEPG